MPRPDTRPTGSVILTRRSDQQPQPSDLDRPQSADPARPRKSAGRLAAQRAGEITTDRFGSRPWLAVTTSTRPLSVT